MNLVRTVTARLAVTRKGARRSLVVAAMAALLLSGAAIPADAGVRTGEGFRSWDRYDDFEGTPSARWTITGDGHFSNNSGWAFSGSEYAYLRTNQTGISSVLTTFNLPARTMRGCTASIHVRAVTKDASVGFLVRRPGAVTGAVQKFFTIRPSQGWQVISLTGVPFVWGQVTEASVRILGHSQPGTGVTDIRVDNFTIQCWT